MRRTFRNSAQNLDGGNVRADSDAGDLSISATDNRDNCESPERYKLLLCSFWRNMNETIIKKRRCKYNNGWETG